MHLLIIGATRGIGLRLLEQALAVGHTVTALACHPQTLTGQPKGLRVIQGDILDPETVGRSMAGQEGVCITIGSA